MTSRSPREFLERHGLAPGGGAGPRPRYNAADARVHTTPLPAPPLPLAEVLRYYEGRPPPDRGATRPWPNRYPPARGLT